MSWATPRHKSNDWQSLEDPLMVADPSSESSAHLLVFGSFSE